MAKYGGNAMSVPEFRYKNSQKQKGRKGRPCRYKGKTYEEYFGKEKAEKVKEKISLNHHDVNGEKNPNAKWCLLNENQTREIFENYKFTS